MRRVGGATGTESRYVDLLSMSIVPEMGRDGECSVYVFYYQLVTEMGWVNTCLTSGLFLSFQNRPLTS
jgi:hypothetical protein